MAHGGGSGRTVEERPWESERECACMGDRSGPWVVGLAWWWPEEADDGGYPPWVAVHGGGGVQSHALERKGGRA